MLNHASPLYATGNTHVIHNSTGNWTSEATKRRCARYSGYCTNYNFTLLPPAVSLIFTPSEILVSIAWILCCLVVLLIFSRRVRKLHYAALWIPHPNLLYHFHYPHTDCVLSVRVDICNKGACASRLLDIILLFCVGDYGCGCFELFKSGKTLVVKQKIKNLKTLPWLLNQTQ